MAHHKKSRPEQPPPEPEVETARDDWPAEPFTAAKWGMAAGASIGIAYVNAHQILMFDTPMYPGDAGIPIMSGFIGGTVLGFIGGWLWVYVRDRWL